MSPLPRTVCAAHKYQHLLHYCHELYHIALGANPRSRRSARCYQSPPIASRYASLRSRYDHMNNASDNDALRSEHRDHGSESYPLCASATAYTGPR